MKLYEVPCNTRVRVTGTDEQVKLHHIDGMYSYCITQDGKVAHLYAGTEVEIIEEKPDENPST